MEEGKGEGEGGGSSDQALSSGESSWCVTLVAVKDLLRRIRNRDGVPLPEGTCRTK